MNLPKIKFVSNFKVNFLAFLFTLFENNKEVNKGALEKIDKQKENTIKLLHNIKNPDLENEEVVAKSLTDIMFISSLIGKNLFNLLIKSYEDYYLFNNINQRSKDVLKEVNVDKIYNLLNEIPTETGIKWKKRLIVIFLVDSYIYNDGTLEGLGLKNYIFIGLPPKISDDFYIILLHELIHLNLNQLNKDKEVLASEITLTLVRRLFPNNKLEEHFKKKVKKNENSYHR